MYHVSAQGVDERMIKIHYYYYVYSTGPQPLKHRGKRQNHYVYSTGPQPLKHRGKRQNHYVYSTGPQPLKHRGKRQNHYVYSTGPQPLKHRGKRQNHYVYSTGLRPLKHGGKCQNDYVIWWLFNIPPFTELGHFVSTLCVQKKGNISVSVKRKKAPRTSVPFPPKASRHKE